MGLPLGMKYYFIYLLWSKTKLSIEDGPPKLVAFD